MGISMVPRGVAPRRMAMETTMGEAFRFGPARLGRLAGAVRVATAVATLASISAAPVPAAGQSPPAVALVPDGSGRTEPVVEPFSEMPAGSAIRLAPGTTLNVLFYASCEELSIAGAGQV